MKLLFDENLSRRLSHRLAELCPGSKHVSDVGLLQAPDSDIWDFAKDKRVRDRYRRLDFFDLVTGSGPPPKVIWLRRWVHPTRDAEALLRREAVRVTEFDRDPDLGVLVLDL